MQLGPKLSSSFLSASNERLDESLGPEAKPTLLGNLPWSLFHTRAMHGTQPRDKACTVLCPVSIAAMRRSDLLNFLVANNHFRISIIEIHF